MLRLTVTFEDSWDAKSDEFIRGETVVIDLEHSLVSLSKWESKYEKPFLGDGEKTPEEIMDYIQFMILTPDFPPEVFSKLSQENVDEIQSYVDCKYSATWFREPVGMPSTRPAQEVITSELIYYWMIAFNIPFECQYWHLNRLFILIKVCNAKNSKPKKQTRAEMISERQRLNAERRAQYHTSG